MAGLEPLFGLLLDLDALGLGEARGDEGGEDLAGVIAGGAGEDGPEVGLGVVLGKAATAPVKRAEFGLSGNAAVLGSLGEPVGGSGIVGSDSLFLVAGDVEKAKSVFSGGIAVGGEVAELGNVGWIGGGIRREERSKQRRWKRRGDGRAVAAAPMGRG